ncbi:hypothetical protein PGAG_00325 [Phaeocystis globosa virus 12T]|uniref:Uncharacterized protein n=1 Tax=Phaeocystis globosa virus PgV-16T TaxID=3071227 RepID=A0AC59EXG2_9VIRU|nr:hypothetical protein PGCG_00364 [Phaeocystis globosa virus]AET73214.1 hypothetical protein PGAG_00325 [Phaeocystis globosa virus 12T]AET74038.1 hypothetical protein PGBG_00330 [Phaeocystis globosa virus 14T]AGM15675.1 hypothetical protein PGCG_00364 [Phaeocystis globosa virus PgV-16T]UYE94405.1 hypothetical protein PGV14T_00364 [Phaeocystis globosa virus]
MNTVKRIEYTPNEIVLTTADEVAGQRYNEMLYYGDDEEDNVMAEENAALEAGLAWAAAIDALDDCEMADMMSGVNINSDPNCDNCNQDDEMMG